MALVWLDRTLETSTTTGTGALSLAAAVTGFQRFSAGCSTNDTVYYSVFAVDANGNPSGDWETGLGTYSSANTLTRTSVSKSSNSNNAVDFAAGTKWVMAAEIAAHLSTLLAAASISDTNTGTSTTKAITPDALAGSNFGIKTIEVLLADPNGSAITTGDGKAFVRIPSDLNGMNLVGCGAVLDTAGTGGGYLLQLRRKRSGSDVDMLSTRISIDSGENDSADAGTPPAINASNDDVATGDRIYFDRDGVPTGGKGDVVWMQFQLP